MDRQMATQNTTPDDLSTLIPGSCAFERGDEGEEWVLLVWDADASLVDNYGAVSAGVFANEAPQVEASLNYSDLSDCAEYIAEHLSAATPRERAEWIATKGM